MSKRLFSSHRVARHNLARFIERQQGENEKIRIAIYETLRCRYFGRHHNAGNLSAEQLRGVAQREADVGALAMLDAAEQLIQSHNALLRAGMCLVNLTVAEFLAK